MARAVHRLAQHFFTAAISTCCAADIQVGLLLAGKRQLRQVFGGGRGTYGDGRVTPAEPGIRFSNSFGNIIWHRTLCEKPPYQAGGLFEHRRLIGGSRPEARRQNLRLQSVLRHKSGDRHP